MAKTLSDFEKTMRNGNPNYFKSGKPKQNAMLCRNQAYIAEVKKINSTYNINWACAGNRCSLYAAGCDNRGTDWK